MMSNIQTALRFVFPPRCVGCGGVVESDFGLCGKCWSETSFIGEVVCDACGRQLLGEADDQRTLCDACQSVTRPWQQGRSVLIYEGLGRKLVLGLKYGDRQDVALAAAKWMARVARRLDRPETIVVPVPIHRWRLMKRRYNQAGLLGQALAKELGRPFCPDLIVRTKEMRTTKGLSARQRDELLSGAFEPHPKRLHLAKGKSALLVDDVFTTGATLSAVTHAAYRAGFEHVDVIALARASKED